MNQNVESAGVAFVKLANIRNCLFEKKKIVYEEQARMNKPNDEQAQGQTDFGAEQC